MPAALIDLLALVLAIAAAAAPPRAAFAILLGSIMLLPDTLAAPGAGTQLTLHRIVLVAVVGGIAWRCAGRKSSWRVWLPTPISLVLLGYLAIVVVIGVALAAPGVAGISAIDDALIAAEQVAVLVAAVALAREIGSLRDLLPVIVAVAAISVGIGVVEHFTGHSWGRFLTEKIPSEASTPSVIPLATRGGSFRIRAGADFPLGYAWTLAALLPAFVAAMFGRRRIWQFALFLLMLLSLTAIYWSGSRSPLIGVAVAVVVLGLCSGDRRVTVLASLLLIAGVVAVIYVPEISHHFSIGADRGSVDVREQRLPVVLGAVAARPLIGSGFSGLSLVGLTSIDQGYLLLYGETGVIGLAALGAVLLVGLLCLIRGLRSVGAANRALAAAMLSGFVVMATSGFAFDAFALPGVADVMWILVAIGVVAAERSLGPARIFRRWPAVLGVTAAAAAVGGVVALLAPSVIAATYSFSVLPGGQDAQPYDPVVTGDQLIATTCKAFSFELKVIVQRPSLASTEVTCVNPYGGPGIGQLRVSADSLAEIDAALPKLIAAAHRAGVADVILVRQSLPANSTLTGLSTLPVSLGVFALLVVMTAPVARRRGGSPPIRAGAALPQTA